MTDADATGPLLREGRTLRVTGGDLTTLEVDVIVNAANEALRGGGGVDGAIHRAAGPGLLDELIARYPAGTPTGTAVLTGGGRLPARAIAHAVGPVWHGGGHDEPRLLAEAHRMAMDLAAGMGARSIAFPAISQGVYGYPTRLAAPVAVGSVDAWLAGHRDASLREVLFVVRGDEIRDAYLAALRALDEASGSEGRQGAST